MTLQARSRDVAKRAESRVAEVLASKWTLHALLGVGGVAAVYEATHRNGKRVAVKILHAHLAHDDDVRTRFLREAYVANSIAHPAVVQLDDDDTDDDGVPFLVMSLVDGCTLEDLLHQRGGDLPAEELLPIVAQLLDVLVVAHAQGVVHRDLKPDNLMVASGKVRVLDFGLARAMESELDQQLTQPGAILGTPSFMAPEQAMGRWELVDARTDLWAIGAICFYALTGRHVHQGDTTQEVLALAGTAPAPLLSDVIADAPEELATFVDRALVYAKAERHADAHEMLRMLREEVAPALGVSLSEPEPRAVVSPVVKSPSPPAALRSANAGSASGDAGRSTNLGLFALGVVVVVVALVAAWRSPLSSSEIMATASVAHGAPPAPAESIAPSPAKTAEEPIDAPPPADPSAAPSAQASAPVEAIPKKNVAANQRAAASGAIPNCTALRDLYCKYPESWLCKSAGMTVGELQRGLKPSGRKSLRATKEEARCAKSIPGAEARAKAEIEEKAQAEITVQQTASCLNYQQRACAAQKSRGSHAFGFCSKAKRQVRQAALADDPAQACQSLHDNFALALTDHERESRERQKRMESTRWRRPLPF